MSGNTLNLKPGDVVYRRYVASMMHFVSYFYTLIISVEGDKIYGYDIHKTNSGKTIKFLSDTWEEFKEDAVVVVWRAQDGHPFAVGKLKNILSGCVIPEPGKLGEKDITDTNAVAHSLLRSIKEDNDVSSKDA